LDLGPKRATGSQDLLQFYRFLGKTIFPKSGDQASFSLSLNFLDGHTGEFVLTWDKFRSLAHPGLSVVTGIFRLSA